MRGDVVRDSDGSVIFATQEFSRELPAPSERMPSVACLRTDIFSFRSYWHKGSALVCTYVGTSRRAAETPTFRANKTTYARAYHGSIFRLYCPPSFDLETPESINGSSDFTFLKCWGVCRSFGNARRIFLGFLVKRCREIWITSQNLCELFLFSRGM